MTIQEKIISISSILMIIGFIIFLIIQPYFEMQTFNKFSETKATYFDAVFSKLRVISVKR